MSTGDKGMPPTPVNNDRKEPLKKYTSDITDNNRMKQVTKPKVQMSQIKSPITTNGILIS